MYIKSTSRYILHMSDFHLTEDKEQLKFASEAIKALASKIKKEKIKVDYLLHTGDVIDSSDLYLKTSQELDCCKDYIIKEDGIKRFDSSAFERSADEKMINVFNSKLFELVNYAL